MSEDPVTSANDYASPPMTLVLTVILLVFFFVGFFSVFFCRCFIQGSPFYSGFNRQNPTPSVPDKPEIPGLDLAILRTFPTFTYAAVKDLRLEKYDLECAICIGEFDDDDVIRLLPQCFHVFHQDCIDLWLESHKTCPICRKNLETAEKKTLTMCEINEDEPLEDSVRIDIPQVVEEMAGGDSRGARVEITNVSDKFPRSHSTGHSIKKRDRLRVDRFTPIKTRENLVVDTFTLRLPEHLHARLLRGHNGTGSCSTFGEFASKTDTGNGGFGEISDFASGDVNKV